MDILKNNNLKQHLNISVAHCTDGELQVAFDWLANKTVIKTSPTEFRRMCLLILQECEKIDACHYSPQIGHA